MKQLLAQLQRVGGALMLPIAVLPVAALLLRLGQPDLMAIPAMAAAGQAIFDNLGLLFAVGVAIGLAQENHGAAAVAAVVGYLVTVKGAAVFITVPASALAGASGHARTLAAIAYKSQELTELTVPVGILSGLIGGALYNRFHRVALPSYLAFFGGRRLVPILSGFAALPLAALLGLEWHHLEHGMHALSRGVLAAGPWGLFAYGVLNRILIVTGLHHILNSIAWFMLGNYHGVTGDLNRFFAGDPTAGNFMTGFFPVMMFGLPAACLAMYHTARPERRAQVAGLLASIALTSFLTGVTEPVEFSFMFLAPGLYAAHALLTGLSFVIMSALHVRLGFGFSAGLFDYVLNYKYAEHPLLLLPVGALYFGLYYGIFRYAIVRFDLKTPGREESAQSVPAGAALAGAGTPGRAQAYVEALGGVANIELVNACTTRLRLTVRTHGAIDEPALRHLGAMGLVRPTVNTLQVVVGPVADQLAGEIREVLGSAPRAGVMPSCDAVPGPTGPPPEAPAGESPALEAALIEKLLAALGGKANVRDVEPAASRLRVSVEDAGRVDQAAIGHLGMRGAAVVAPGCVHVIVGPAAHSTSRALRRLIGQPA